MNQFFERMAAVKPPDCGNVRSRHGPPCNARLAARSVGRSDFPRRSAGIPFDALHAAQPRCMQDLDPLRRVP